MIYIQHIVLKFQGHRTLIVTTHKPWWLKIFFWLKPLGASYVGSGTMWYHTATGKQCPAWLTKQLEDAEQRKKLQRLRKKLGIKSKTKIQKSIQ